MVCKDQTRRFCVLTEGQQHGSHHVFGEHIKQRVPKVVLRSAGAGVAAVARKLTTHCGGQSLNDIANCLAELTPCRFAATSILCVQHHKSNNATHHETEGSESKFFFSSAPQRFLFEMFSCFCCLCNVGSSFKIETLLLRSGHTVSSQVKKPLT